MQRRRIALVRRLDVTELREQRPLRRPESRVVRGEGEAVLDVGGGPVERAAREQQVRAVHQRLDVIGLQVERAWSRSRNAPSSSPSSRSRSARLKCAS